MGVGGGAGEASPREETLAVLLRPLTSLLTADVRFPHQPIRLLSADTSLMSYGLIPF